MRRRPPSLVAALAVMLIGCASEPRDHRTHAERERVETPEPPPESWSGFASLPTLRVAGEVRSAHPAGDFMATIQVNEAAGTYGTKSRPPLAPGATVVAALRTAVGTDVSTYYVMERRAPGYFPEGGDWAYFVVDPTGKVEAGGKLKLCARCHAEAPREHLFESLRAATAPDSPL
jgi:hypothetical protein